MKITLSGLTPKEVLAVMAVLQPTTARVEVEERLADSPDATPPKGSPHRYRASRRCPMSMDGAHSPHDYPEGWTRCLTCNVTLFKE